MTTFIPAYAGEYLKPYELSRYTWLQRNLRVMDAIVSPSDAEVLSDVSFYQAGMNWDYYATKARAAIIRIGQNVWKDSEFERNYSEAHRVGVALGGYWFFDGRATPNQQADIIIAAMTGKSFELELYIDWERSYSGAYEGLPNVVLLMQRLEAAGVKCKAVGLYTGYYWFTANSNASVHASQYTWLKSRPLHLAWYAAASVVKIPPPWMDYKLWQYGTPVLDMGQPTAEIDMNRSRYTRAEFTAQYLGQVTPPPPPDGGNMHYFQLDNNSTSLYRTVRAPHPVSHIQGGYIGQINAGGSGKGVVADKYVYAADVVVNGSVMAKAGDIWHHCFEANGAPIDGWIAEIHKGVRYLNVTEIGAPVTPPPPQGVTYTVKVTVDETAKAVTGVNVDGVDWVKQ